MVERLLGTLKVLGSILSTIANVHKRRTQKDREEDKEEGEEGGEEGLLFQYLLCAVHDSNVRRSHSTLFTFRGLVSCLVPVMIS